MLTAAIVFVLLLLFGGLLQVAVQNAWLEINNAHYYVVQESVHTDLAGQHSAVTEYWRDVVKGPFITAESCEAVADKVRRNSAPLDGFTHCRRLLATQLGDFHDIEGN